LHFSICSGNGRQVVEEIRRHDEPAVALIDEAGIDEAGIESCSGVGTVKPLRTVDTKA